LHGGKSGDSGDLSPPTCSRYSDPIWIKQGCQYVYHIYTAMPNREVKWARRGHEGGMKGNAVMQVGFLPYVDFDT